MNKPLIGIVGSSGSGKSTSLRNLPADKTIIIDLERKGLPFREAKNFHTISASTLPEIDSSENVQGLRCVVILQQGYPQNVGESKE